jgi:deoxyribose-phosphate aldolase
MSATLVTPSAPQLELADAKALAALIDHTLLRPDASAAEISAHCRQALHFGFATVFVHAHWLPLAADILRNSTIKLGTPIGFPFGAQLTSIKRAEAEAATRLGAQELDMVINLGALKSGDRAQVEYDIRGVAQIAHAGGALLKVIIETGLLSMDEKILACELSVAARADFVKTCTGINGGAATVDDIALMRGVVGNRAGVKASGGIRNAAAVQAMVAAGANRIGTTTGVEIMASFEAGAAL